MKIAFLIQAHKAPQQLKRLLSKLQKSYVDCYVNIDLKASIEPYNCIPNEFSNVKLIKKRVPVFWAEYSQVESTLNGLKEIVDSGINYEYVFFISGQDYPIKPLEELYLFLMKNRGKQFLSNVELSPNGWYKAMNRYQRYYIPTTIKQKYLNLPIISKVLHHLIYKIPKRKYPNSLKPYGGSSWWCITYDCIQYVLNYCNLHPEFIRFHKYTRSPDEMFFQSLIMNSLYAKDVVNDNLIYLDFSQGNPNPKLLNNDDFDKISCSTKFFARKFDVEYDYLILDAIDKLLI